MAAGVGAQSSFAVKQGRRTLTTGRENTGAGGAAGYMPGNALEDGSGGAVDELDDDDDDDDDDGAAEEEEGQGEEEDLYQERSCYLCKNWFKKLHHFYDQFCPACADVSYSSPTNDDLLIQCHPFKRWIDSSSQASPIVACD